MLTFGIAVIGIIAWLIGASRKHAPVPWYALLLIAFLTLAVIGYCGIDVSGVLSPANAQSSSLVENLQKGHTELSENNFASAKEFFLAADRISPKNRDVYWGLGKSALGSGDYEEARRYFSGGYQLSGPDDAHRDAMFLLDLALAQEGLTKNTSDFADQMKWLNVCVQTYEKLIGLTAAEGDSAEIYRNAVFSRAQIEPKIWLLHEDDDSRFDEAKEGFEAFINLHGKPDLWAFYHLACLYTVRSLITKNQADAAAASEDWNLFSVKLRTFPGTNRDLYRAMRDRLLSENDSSGWDPGDPVVCPALRMTARKGA